MWPWRIKQHFHRVEHLLRQILQEQELNMDEVRASFAQLNVELDRIAVLVASGVITAAELDEIKASVAAAVVKAQGIV